MGDLSQSTDPSQHSPSPSHSPLWTSPSSFPEIKFKMAEEEVDIDLADPEVGKAASKIQSCFKARMARKSPKEAPKESPAPPPPEKEEVEEKEAEEEVVDIDLEDPEVNEAAKKMQACFKARKKTV